MKAENDDFSQVLRLLIEWLITLRFFKETLFSLGLDVGRGGSQDLPKTENDP